MEILVGFLKFVFDTFVIFCVIHFIFSFLRGYKSIDPEQSKKIAEYLDRVIHVVEVETHGDINYWYDKDSSEFLAQGTTREEIIKKLKSRFPNHIFLLNDDEMLVGPDLELIKIKDIRNLQI